MPRRIQDSVVVITGASSGIGRAAALAFAKRGASVVVAARRERPLQEVADQCVSLGGRSLIVPTDVTNEEAVQNLARRAVEQFGRIDVWVNNAAVSLLALFEQAPPEAFRRVIETNLFGYIHGARAALPYFREQGSGILMNNASIVGKTGQAYASPYVISKFGIRGLSECLRQELSLDGAQNIHLCTILPASIDTPIFQHAGNFTGRAIKPLTPIYDAEQVALAIVHCAENPKREVIVGNSGRMMAALHALTPRLFERMTARQVKKNHFQDRPASPTPGNIFESMPEWTSISGGWKTNLQGATPRIAYAGMAAIVPVLLTWWFRPHVSRLFPGVSGRAESLFDLLKPLAGRLGRAVMTRTLHVG